ncbi:MAG: N-acetyltransferase [Bacteroidales bacterium]|nr:N-acetyltransferase [Bacteroidales bacterium]
MIHPLSDCQAIVPDSTNVWQYCVVLPNAKIGENCNICSHCFIENDVKIGNSVTIKSGVQIWDGIEIGDNVFVGANVTFTNDKYPKSGNEGWQLLQTTICEGASIGAGSTILPGLTIGKNSVVGAGSVVTKNIPDGEVWYGNPAKYVKKI